MQKEETREAARPGLEPEQVVPESLGAWCRLQKQGLGAQTWSAKPDDRA